MTGFSPDYFLHAANILLLVAYSVRDILWLRMFAVAAALISIPYFFLQSPVLWSPVAWSACFAGINLLQAWRLFVERRPIKLTAEEAEVRRLAFSDVPPRKVLQILNIGAWSTGQPGERLLESGKVPVDIALIVRGNVRITRAGLDVATLAPGEFVGSALILSGLPADLDAVVEEPVRVVRWHVGTLEKYLNANPDMRIVMQRHLARELTGKLKQLIDGSVRPGEGHPE
jgi:hypothetical protein